MAGGGFHHVQIGIIFWEHPDYSLAKVCAQAYAALGHATYAAEKINQSSPAHHSLQLPTC